MNGLGPVDDVMRGAPVPGMFEELVGGASCVRGQEKDEKSGWGVSWTTSELSISTPNSEQLYVAKDEEE